MQKHQVINAILGSMRTTLKNVGLCGISQEGAAELLAMDLMGSPWWPDKQTEAVSGEKIAELFDIRQSIMKSVIRAEGEGTAINPVFIREQITRLDEFIDSLEVAEAEPVGEVKVRQLVPEQTELIIEWKRDLEVGTKLYTAPQPAQVPDWQPLMQSLDEFYSGRQQRITIDRSEILGLLDSLIQNRESDIDRRVRQLIAIIGESS